jgi:hypothetical protein
MISKISGKKSSGSPCVHFSKAAHPFDEVTIKYIDANSHQKITNCRFNIRFFLIKKFPQFLCHIWIVNVNFFHFLDLFWCVLRVIVHVSVVWVCGMTKNDASVI